LSPFPVLYTSVLNRKTRLASNQLNIILITLFISCMGTGVFLAICVIFYPKYPIHFGNVIPTEYFTAPVHLLHSIYYVQCHLVIYANMNVIVFIITIYGSQVIPFVAREFYVGQMNSKKFYRTSNALRTVKNMLIEYRSIELLHEHFMGVLGFILVPLHFVFVKLILFCWYVLIRHSSGLRSEISGVFFMWSFAGCLFWSGLLQIGGAAYVQSDGVLHSWKLKDWGSSYNNRLMSKFRKSCKPILIKYGSTYVVKRLSLLKFLKGLTRGLFRILLLID